MTSLEWICLATVNIVFLSSSSFLLLLIESTVYEHVQNGKFVMYESIHVIIQYAVLVIRYLFIFVFCILFVFQGETEIHSSLLLEDLSAHQPSAQSREAQS